MSLFIKEITAADVKKYGINVLKHKFQPVIATSGPQIDGKTGSIGYVSVNNIIYATNLFISENLAKKTNSGNSVLTDFFTPKFIYKDNIVNPIVFSQKTGAGYQVMVRAKYNFQPEDLVLADNSNGVTGVLGGTVSLEKIYRLNDVLLEVRPSASHHIITI